MRYAIFLNRNSGAARGQGVTNLYRRIRAAFDEAGIEAEIELLHPSSLGPRIEAAIGSDDPPDAVLIGGGDGSVSSTAQTLLKSEIALGVLPLGTFNLFARAIGMPLDPASAVKALLKSKPAWVDTVDINGRTVLQHASIGLQPRVVRLRDEAKHHSRIGKIAKGTLAWMRVIRRPPLLELSAASDRERVVRVTPAMMISNNTMREGLGEPPVSDNLDRGEIAVYLLCSCRRADLVKLALAATIGAWRQTGLVEELIASEIQISSRKRDLLMSVDGELERFRTPLKCRSVPRSLKVLVPPAVDQAA